MNLKDKLKAKMAEQEALVNLVVTESRGLTVEEKSKYDALEADINGLEAAIEAQAAIDRRIEEQNKVVNPPVATVVVNEKKWQSFGDQLQAVRKASEPGGAIDNRLLVGIKNASGANEAINSDGGFMVDTDFVAELLKNTYETSVMAKLARKIPIGANANGVSMNGVDETSRANGSRWGGVQAYWSGEAQTVTATRPKFKKLELKLDKLMALCYATDELLSDATALDAVIRQAFTEEMGFKLDDAILNGNGAGLPLGIMSSGSLVTVAKENNQTADTVVHNNIVKMFNRCWGRSRANAVWLINQDIEPSLETMIYGTDNVSPLAKEYMEKGTLKGRPVIPVEQASTLGDLGDIVLADLSQYMLIDKGGIVPATSVHVRFLYDEQVFRFTYRVNGMPIWSAPLTPFKGSNTLSPFVTLAERA